MLFFNYYFKTLPNLFHIYQENFLLKYLNYKFLLFPIFLFIKYPILVFSERIPKKKKKLIFSFKSILFTS
jgi:hypothetical protein